MIVIRVMRLTPSISSGPPTKCAPAFLASSACLPSAKTKILSSLIAFASLGRFIRPFGTATPFFISVLTKRVYADFGDATSTAYMALEFESDM